MSAIPSLLLFLLFFFDSYFQVLSTLPDSNPLKIQPLHLTPTPPITIPAFPEQSDVSGCSLNLPDELFPNIKSACGTAHEHHHVVSGSGQQRLLHYSRCCPVLAAWLYAAYSDTALKRIVTGKVNSSSLATAAAEMPQLPDDSETCVDNFEKSMRGRKMELLQPNVTCDVMYCYCGIRLHPFSCPGTFWVDEKGKIVGDERVKKLEKECLSTNLGGCSKCLSSLYELHGEKSRNTSKSEDRTSKIQNTDCQLMGLTWLLAKNRTAYIHTVTSVLRAIMMTSDDADHPMSCTLNSDGLPLAVDSSEISGQSLPNTRVLPVYVKHLAMFVLYMINVVWFL